MDQNRVRKSRIEIPLPSKPRPYRPGDGPALAPLRIALKNDSNAFIVDRRVLPGTPVNGELKLEMYYVVGWPDLPAARMTILATKILDYVSPRTLEDWEYKYSLEKDEERERQEAEVKRKAEEAARARQSAALAAGPSKSVTPKSSTASVPGQKRRGRPSKADLKARKLARQTSYADAETAEVSMPPADTSGPSLSTPRKKRKLATDIAMDAEDLGEADQDVEDVDEADPDDAIYQQLYGNSKNMDELGMEWEDEEAKKYIPLPSPFQSSFPYGPSDKPKPKPEPPNRYVIPDRITPVPVPCYPVPKFKTPSEPRAKLTPTVPVRDLAQPPISREKVFTPVPTPSYPLPPPKRPPEPRENHPLPHERPPNTITPIPIPSYGCPTQGGSQSVPEPEAVVEHSGFTPAGRSFGKWPPEWQDESPSQATANATPVRPHPRKKQKLQPPEHEEPVYEVKRLEGERVTMVNEKPTRHFKVRWEGNWPAGQNPTWEPEENIDASLVRQYLKKNEKAGKAVSSLETVARTSRRPASNLKRKYSSVAEAFEGEAEGAQRGSGPITPAGDSERMSVTEQRSDRNSPTEREQFDAAGLARELASSFHGGGRRSRSSGS